MPRRDLAAPTASLPVRLRRCQAAGFIWQWFAGAVSSGCHQAAACSAAKPAKERGGRPVTCRRWLVTGARLLLAITLWSSRNGAQDRGDLVKAEGFGPGQLVGLAVVAVRFERRQMTCGWPGTRSAP
jgi:hypothetical protein